jgi:hypothetical protein
MERRDFLKTLTTGLALGSAHGGSALAEFPPNADASELRGGSGIVHLVGQLKAGTLIIDAQDFLDREARTVTMRGKLNSTDLYSAMFSDQNDLAVFAIFRDNNHSTSIVLSDSDDRAIGRVVVWNDNDSPQTYDISKKVVMAAKDLKDLRDQANKTPDLLGKRNHPLFTWQELEKALGSDPSLLAFMRGGKTNHHPPEKDEEREWICRFCSWVPDSLLSIIWRP